MSLDELQRAAYRQNGYYYPVRAMSGLEAKSLGGKFQDYWVQNSEVLNDLLPRERASFLVETHLYLRWVYEIVIRPEILDTVESVIGPDIMVWSSQWFTKFPKDHSYVSWHQDATYWGLSPANVTTAWLALSASTTDNGCLRVIPGTHLKKLPQRETWAEMNMLSRGQEISVELDESAAVDFILQPGEFSLHHVGIVHGSGPNNSNEARIGIAVRYISPDVVQQGSERDMVMLVRGKDDYGHFDILDPPQADQARGNCGVHTESLARKVRNLMSGDQSVKN